eukprot:403334469
MLAEEAKKKELETQNVVGKNQRNVVSNQNPRGQRVPQNEMSQINASQNITLTRDAYPDMFKYLQKQVDTYKKLIMIELKEMDDEIQLSKKGLQKSERDVADQLITLMRGLLRGEGSDNYAQIWNNAVAANQRFLFDEFDFALRKHNNVKRLVKRIDFFKKLYNAFVSFETLSVIRKDKKIDVYGFKAPYKIIYKYFIKELKFDVFSDYLKVIQQV